MPYFDLSINHELDPDDPENYDSLPETYDPDAYWGEDVIDTYPDNWAL